MNRRLVMVFNSDEETKHVLGPLEDEAKRALSGIGTRAAAPSSVRKGQAFPSGWSVGPPALTLRLCKRHRELARPSSLSTPSPTSRRAPP